MASSNGDGGWATGGSSGFALARDCFTMASRSRSRSSTRRRCRSAFCRRPWRYEACPARRHGVHPGRRRRRGASRHPGRQRIRGAGRVVSSGSSDESMRVAKASGADHLSTTRATISPLEMLRLTGGKGADVVFDATYSEKSFVDSARMVREGGTWIVLGDGPGKTTRVAETDSPVDAILAGRHARNLSANLLRYFIEPLRLDEAARIADPAGDGVGDGVGGRRARDAARRQDRRQQRRGDQQRAARDAGGDGPVGKIAVLCSGRSCSAVAGEPGPAGDGDDDGGAADGEGDDAGDALVVVGGGVGAVRGVLVVRGGVGERARAGSRRRPIGPRRRRPRRRRRRRGWRRRDRRARAARGGSGGGVRRGAARRRRAARGPARPSAAARSPARARSARGSVAPAPRCARAATCADTRGSWRRRRGSRPSCAAPGRARTGSRRAARARSRAGRRRWRRRSGRRRSCAGRARAAPGPAMPTAARRRCARAPPATSAPLASVASSRRQRRVEVDALAARWCACAGGRVAWPCFGARTCVRPLARRCARGVAR